jgi:hypothetical protein
MISLNRSPQLMLQVLRHEFVRPSMANGHRIEIPSNKDREGFMRRLVVALMLACTALNAKAADDSIFGTHWVKFQPIQAGGVLKGCELVFLAVTSDRVYLNGNNVAINGSIVLRGSDKGLGLALKIGLKDMTTGSPFERPAFAYLQTASASTAKAKQLNFDGDEGYKVFAYSATDTVILEMLNELMSTSKVSIGYNRKEGGMDVLVPLDLMVTDSEYTATQKVLRKHSPDAVLGFADCNLKVIDGIPWKGK